LQAHIRSGSLSKSIQVRNQPEVSVVTIFFNEERFLREAIESVVAQTRSDWELLLVNDGSTDSSPAIARQYSERYPGKVRCIEHEGRSNRGMSASRNLGIAQAKGKYISFLDADDVWFPYKLEQQVAILEAHPRAAMVYGNRQYWRSWTGSLDDSSGDSVSRVGFRANTVVEPPKLLIFTLLLGKMNPGSDITFRRELVERVGGFEEGFRGMYEDIVFQTKVFLHEKVFVSTQCWSRYRTHPNSCSSLAIRSGNKHREWMKFLTWCQDYISAQNIEDPGLRRFLETSLSSRPPSRASRGRAVMRPRRSLKMVRAISRGLRSLWDSRHCNPPAGWVRFGSLRRLTPISRNWGFDRGRPIDRYYIEKFLEHQRDDIQGHVLEIGDPSYTWRYGGGRVSKSEVLDVDRSNPDATIYVDLSNADSIAANQFDCIIFTQTLQLIYDVQVVVRTLYRILKPGGVLLATLPAISRRVPSEDCGYTNYWGFTSASAGRLFEETFSDCNVQVKAYGNVLAAVCFLQGLSAHELREDELEYEDPAYEVTITVRASKALQECSAASTAGKVSG